MGTSKGAVAEQAIVRWFIFGFLRISERVWVWF